MALGFCKICSDLVKNLCKKQISLSQKIVSSKFIHNNGLRNDNADDLRTIVSETVIKLSRPNINSVENITRYEKKDSPDSNLKLSQATPTSVHNYGVNKLGKEITELQTTPVLKYWSNDLQYKNISQVRYYSTNNKKNNKCKKENEKCPKMIAPCCDAPARKSCRYPLDTSTCCKQEAPYPSYSEKCVEEVINKPSECKLCPWTPDKHPYFEYVDEFPHFRHPKKPRKKRYSTLATVSARQYSTTGQSTTSKNDSSGNLLAINQHEILSICSNIRLEKKPCKPPPPKCKPEPPKCDTGKKEKSPEPKKKNQDDCKKKCSSLNNEELLLDCLSNEKIDLRSKNKNEYVKKGKVRKFPFPNPPPVKKIDTETPCPKHKSKPPIKDCPTGGGCQQCLPNAPLQLLLHLTNENVPFPLSFQEQANFLNGSIHQLYLEDDKDNKCPPTNEKSKVCPKESLILPKRRKVKRPPLCSEKEGNKKGK